LFIYILADTSNEYRFLSLASLFHVHVSGKGKWSVLVSNGPGPMKRADFKRQPPNFIDVRWSLKPICPQTPKPKKSIPCHHTPALPFPCHPLLALSHRRKSMRMMALERNLPKEADVQIGGFHLWHMSAARPLFRLSFPPWNDFTSSPHLRHCTGKTTPITAYGWKYYVHSSP
jgi:hypothetical protein